MIKGSAVRCLVALVVVASCHSANQPQPTQLRLNPCPVPPFGAHSVRMVLDLTQGAKSSGDSTGTLLFRVTPGFPDSLQSLLALIHLTGANGVGRNVAFDSTNGWGRLDGLPAGRYRLDVRSLGRQAFTDSVTVRAQRADTVYIGLRRSSDCVIQVVSGSYSVQPSGALFNQRMPRMNIRPVRSRVLTPLARGAVWHSGWFER
jgi:hypothetical protein